MAANWRRWRMFLPSLRHIFLMLYFGDNGWMDESFGLFNWQKHSQLCPHYCNIYSDCKIISIWLLLGRCTFFKKKILFPDSGRTCGWSRSERIQTLEIFFFFFFSIPCISCMLMFCACFCKDWMRYCNIFATIALDSCTWQLSINMLKE